MVVTVPGYLTYATYLSSARTPIHLPVPEFQLSLSNQLLTQPPEELGYINDLFKTPRVRREKPRERCVPKSESPIAQKLCVQESSKPKPADLSVCRDTMG